MISRLQDMSDGAPRGLMHGRLRFGGIAIAVVSAGLAAGLSGCGPASLAGKADQLHDQQGAAGTSGQHANSGTASRSSGTVSGQYSSGNASSAYSFTTLDNPAGPTFNQLLGFNDNGVIAGYYGSGNAGQPNEGYLLVRTAAGFAVRSENFPGAVQTQVTGLNNRGVTVGFWSSMNNSNQVNDNTGFYQFGGRFHSVSFPAADNATPPVNQLLGVNDQDVAVGFYNDANGNSHGYTYSIFTGRFHSVTVPGATSLTAAAINNAGDVAGFYTDSAGATDGFLRTSGGRVYTLAYPGASMTQALGVNDSREVVGAYTDGSGSSAVTHGFVWSLGRGFQTVDDPQGVGTTTVNGVNDQGDLVGFYTDSAGNTDGFAAVPGGQNTLPGLIGAASPAPSASPSSSPSPSPSSSPSASPSAPGSGVPSGPPPFSGTNS